MKLSSILSARKWTLLALHSRPARLIVDEQYLKMEYWAVTGEKLNLDNPKTYTEKLQWLKLYDRKPEYVVYSDKFAVRDHVAKTVGPQHLIPLLGVYDSYDEIDFAALPDQFVLKANHTSGDRFFCTDKSAIDHVRLKKTLGRWMRRNYYWLHREWPYRDIRPRIVCEQFMRDEQGSSIPDFKFFCFDGEPKVFQICRNRNGHGGLTVDFYDTDYNYLPSMLHPGYKQAGPVYQKPERFDEMLHAAKALSDGMPLVRVDLYHDKAANTFYVGEITLYPSSGYDKFEPRDCNEVFGNWITLPPKGAGKVKTT
jgi:hypothetical protein